VDLIANGGINVKSPLLDERYILRELDSAAMDPREVIPAPIGASYLGCELQKIEWHWTLISELAHCGKYYFSERPRSPMAARGVTPAETERSGVSRRHDAGSHSVDRIVRHYILFMSMLIPLARFSLAKWNFHAPSSSNGTNNLPR
jgi:hypothetical protein